MSDINLAYSNGVYPNNIFDNKNKMNEKGKRYDVVLPNNTDISNPSVLVIDSNHINDTLYQKNKYTIKLTKPYKDVTQIQLITTDIPNSLYNIDKYHNLLYISENSGDINTVTITEGSYTISELVSAITTAINSIGLSNTYSVTVNTITKLIKFTATAGTAPYTLHFEGFDEHYGLWTNTTTTTIIDGNKVTTKNALNGETVTKYKTNSIGKIIGFGHKDYDSTSGVITSPYFYNLKISRYIILKIKGLERTDSWNDKVQDCFCILTLDQRVNNFNNADDSDCIDKDQYTKYFNPPLPTLNEMQIEFLTEDGNPYDFHGREHVLVFQIHSLSRTGVFKQ